MARLDPRSKPEAILALGIKSEIDAARLYRQVRSQVRNTLLRQKLDFLIVEETHHRTVLEGLFRDRFGARKLVLPARSFLSASLGPLSRRLSVPRLFEAALKSEKISEDFYREAAAGSADPGGRKMLLYLSRVERSHFFMLKSEVDLLAKFPDYYKVEDFQVGQDMIHVGP